MSVLRYITHPQVEVDLTLPVTAWHLSDVGRARTVALCMQPWVDRIGRIVSSAETKAIETAHILGKHLGLEFEVREESGENDRSATGPVPKAEFESLADAFFARPEESVRGWERATDAQRRISQALADLLAIDPAYDIAVIGHGGVGTLWYCALTGTAIDRRHDQPGQGHYFSVDLASRRPVHAWRAIDA